MLRSTRTVLLEGIGMLLLQAWILPLLSVPPYAAVHLQVLHLLLLPYRWPVWSLLLWAFALGITLDVLMLGYGVYALAGVMLVGLREVWFQYLAPQSLGARPDFNLARQPLLWVMGYLAAFTLMHELTFYFIEELSVGLSTMLKVLISTAYTLMISMGCWVILYRR